MMGTESGFVRHEKVSSSFDFLPGKSDEEKKLLLAVLVHCIYFIQSSHGS